MMKYWMDCVEIMYSVRNIILRVVDCVRVLSLKGTRNVILACTLHAITLNRSLTICGRIIFIKIVDIVLKHAFCLFRFSKKYSSFLFFFFRKFNFCCPPFLLVLQIYLWSQMRATFEHMGRTITKKAKFSINCLIIVKNFFVFHH